MRSYRRMYVIILAVTVFLLFWSEKAFLIGLLAVEIVVPILIHILLIRDASGVLVRPAVPNACRTGQTVTVRIEVIHKKRLLAAGQLEMELEMENRLFGATETKTFRIPLTVQQGTIEIPYTPMLCGEIHLQCKRLSLYGLFALDRAEIELPSRQILTAFPGRIPVELFPGKSSRGHLEGEQFFVTHKGPDISEIYDMREYYPGDDVRSIHWKLSEKLDTVIVREGSETSHYDTVILFDAGLKDGENEMEKELLSATVELAVTVSEKLVELGISHYMALPGAGRLELVSVSERAGHTLMTEFFMGMTIWKERRMGLRSFIAEQMQYRFTKVIYVGAGRFPGELREIAAHTDITAVCVDAGGERVNAARMDGCRVVEIPLALLREQTNVIEV